MNAEEMFIESFRRFYVNVHCIHNNKPCVDLIGIVDPPIALCWALILNSLKITVGPRSVGRLRNQAGMGFPSKSAVTTSAAICQQRIVSRCLGPIPWRQTPLPPPLYEVLASLRITHNTNSSMQLQLEKTWETKCQQCRFFQVVPMATWLQAHKQMVPSYIFRACDW